MESNKSNKMWGRRKELKKLLQDYSNNNLNGTEISIIISRLCHQKYYDFKLIENISMVEEKLNFEAKEVMQNGVGRLEITEKGVVLLGQAIFGYRHSDYSYSNDEKTKFLEPPQVTKGEFKKDEKLVFLVKETRNKGALRKKFGKIKNTIYIYIPKIEATTTLE